MTTDELLERTQKQLRLVERLTANVAHMARVLHEGKSVFVQPTSDGFRWLACTEIADAPKAPVRTTKIKEIVRQYMRSLNGKPATAIEVWQALQENGVYTSGKVRGQKSYIRNLLAQPPYKRVSKGKYVYESTLGLADC